MPLRPEAQRNRIGPDDAAIPTAPIYRLSVDQYHAMADHGILTEEDPVELLEGWLVQKMTKHRPHSRCTRRTRRALDQLPEKEREVVKLRYGINGDEPTPLVETGRRLGISQDTVRRLERKALAELAESRELDALRPAA